MKCPNCHNKIGLLSKTLNTFNKVIRCPHCCKQVTLYIDFKVASILFVPFILLSLFVVKPLFQAFGLNTGIATGIACAILMILSARLKSE
jgi:DNA-directed RNA polymerase subunit RPC12/RpoP